MSVFMVALVSLPVLAGQDYSRWGPWAGKFYLPMTYADFDPEDFGETQPGELVDMARRYRPRIYVAPGGLRPIDFYRDYLPGCVLRDGEGEVMASSPSRAQLKRAERTYGAYLEYTGPRKLDGDPVAYVRVYREEVRLVSRSGPVRVPFTFLKYNFVFLRSGLPARLPAYKEWMARLAGDPDRWHDLDIHGAVIVALADMGRGEAPVALILAQHNHFRTYLFGRDVALPGDGRAAVSFAMRSNEPYPAPAGPAPATFRAVGDPSAFGYVITGSGWSVKSGLDLVYGPAAGAGAVEYRIKTLPSRDPLYVSWIPLGARLKIFGVIDSFFRTGPPGIGMYSWPELKEFGEIMKFWFVDDGDAKAARLFDENVRSFDDARLGPVLEYNGRRFSREFFKLHGEME